VALWREALLAQKVLRGETKGYCNHPQLIRFRSCTDPIAAISNYLIEVAKVARERNYRFDESKIIDSGGCALIEETEGQLQCEWEHLKRKLASRNSVYYEAIRTITLPEAHPLFTLVSGEVRDWEKR
jgi:hypothetical protein